MILTSLRWNQYQYQYFHWFNWRTIRPYDTLKNLIRKFIETAVHSEESYRHRDGPVISQKGLPIQPEIVEVFFPSALFPPLWECFGVQSWYHRLQSWKTQLCRGQYWWLNLWHLLINTTTLEFFLMPLYCLFLH